MIGEVSTRNQIAKISPAGDIMVPKERLKTEIRKFRIKPRVCIATHLNMLLACCTSADDDDATFKLE
jgi:hypothetical protein